MTREEVASICRAMSDTNRLRILEMLTQGEKCGCNLLEELQVTQPTLSHHMKVLTDNGVVTATRSGKWTIYSVNRPVLQEAAERLEAFLSEAEHAEKSDIAIRARATVAEERVQEEKKKSLISEEVRGAESAVGPVAGMREQTDGVHEQPAQAVEPVAGMRVQPASAVEPVAGMREQTAGAHEPSGKKKGKKGKKSKKGGKK